MKPQSPNCGEFKPIATNVPGIQICELLPQLSQHMDKLALLRSMSTREADHVRGAYYLQTGYAPAPGTNHPMLGSLVSAELGEADFALPNFFWLGGRGLSTSAGFLGAKHAPFWINNIQDKAEQNLEDVRPASSPEIFERQMIVLDRLDERFQRQRAQAAMVRDHRATYQQAVRLMRSNKLDALDLDRESKATRELYGATQFGKSALLARRLVEVGVPFVGIHFGDWDTHIKNWIVLRQQLPELDRVMSALLVDLDAHGLLADTLVVWMGEFGRSAQISTASEPGREHNAEGWTTVLAGAGLKTGQAIGRTGKDGQGVEERPITTADFMATVCKALEIDYTKENITPDGRPIRIVDLGGEPVTELFG